MPVGYRTSWCDRVLQLPLPVPCHGRLSSSVVHMSTHPRINPRTQQSVKRLEDSHHSPTFFIQASILLPRLDYLKQSTFYYSLTPLQCFQSFVKSV